MDNFFDNSNYGNGYYGKLFNKMYGNLLTFEKYSKYDKTYMANISKIQNYGNIHYG